MAQKYTMTLEPVTTSSSDAFRYLQFHLVPAALALQLRCDPRYEPVEKAATRLLANVGVQLTCRHSFFVPDREEHQFVH